jgi:hypothetical protein
VFLWKPHRGVFIWVTLNFNAGRLTHVVCHHALQWNVMEIFCYHTAWDNWNVDLAGSDSLIWTGFLTKALSWCMSEGKKKKGKAIPVRGREGLWNIEDVTFYRQSAHRWRWECRPYAPAALYAPRRLLVFISVRGWMDSRTSMRLRGLAQLKEM